MALLFKQLGISSVLTLFSAVLAEQKILFYSSSFSLLTDSCMALTSLIYPMLYTHTLIPVLPYSIVEWRRWCPNQVSSLVFLLTG